VHFILIKPVLSDHLSYVTLFQRSLGRSHNMGLTVLKFVDPPILLLLDRVPFCM